MEMLPGAGSEAGQFYVVKKVAPVTGQDLRVAKPGLDENNQPAVMFELKSAGAANFGKLSGENLGRYLAIILDNRVVSAPRLEGRITDSGRISPTIWRSRSVPARSRRRSRISRNASSDPASALIRSAPASSPRWRGSC
jgi:preprotein translocase subunit SecD